MMNTSDNEETLDLLLTVRQSVTVLPRCLQILSRRGFVLTKLVTEKTKEGDTVLHFTVSGPKRWHKQLVRLLERLVDVDKVRAGEARHA